MNQKKPGFPQRFHIIQSIAQRCKLR